VKIRSIFLIGSILALFSYQAVAQNRTVFVGEYNAIDYAYGVVSTVQPLRVNVGFTAPASPTTLTLTLAFGNIALGDGTIVMPLATNAPITVGVGANAETVTPSAVSCSTPAIYSTCTVTATFSNGHGTGEPITSGTYGLQEAIDAANAVGGGEVAINARWGTIGGTSTIIAAVPFSNVVLLDNRSGPTRYWSMQPSTLTAISAPTTLTGTTVTFTASPVGTWGTSAYYFCITYVDALGGESPCSASYTQTPGVTSYSLNITAPAASTGAVGWRAYGGVTSTALAYLLPITSSNCTLTTLESVMPACAIGANGVWTAIYTTTTQLSPLALGVTNQNNPVPQSHTTFAYSPSGSLPTTFQTNYGPFASGAVSSATAGDVTVLGTIQLPTGYLNYIGRTVRFYGKIVLGATSTGTTEIILATSWAGGATAGLPKTICDIVDTGAVLATANYAIPFSCTWTTNAVGTTAVGSIQADGRAIASTTATLGLAWGDNSQSAVGSVGLFSQDSVYVYLKPATEAATAVQLMDFHVETLQ
jgi:hypothetical protein